MATDAIPNGTQNNIPVYQRLGLDFADIYGQNRTTLPDNPLNNFDKPKKASEAYNLGQTLTAKFDKKPDRIFELPKGSTFSIMV